MKKNMQKKMALLVIMLTLALSFSGVIYAQEQPEKCCDNPVNGGIGPLNSHESSDLNGQDATNPGVRQGIRDDEGRIEGKENNQEFLQRNQDGDLQSDEDGEVTDGNPNNVAETIQNTNSIQPLESNSASSYPSPIQITQGSWDKIGLDSDDPSEGPNQFYIQLHIKNTGRNTINNVTATLEWLDSNQYINLAAGESLIKNLGSLAPGETKDLFYLVEVIKNAAAFGTERDYRVTISGDNVISKTFRGELEVERLLETARQNIISITASNYSPNVGDLIKVTVISRVNVHDLQTLSIPIIGYDPAIIQPVSAFTFYDSIKTADLKIHDPNEIYFTSLWTFKVIAAGQTTLIPFIYDRVNPYFYNEDFGQDNITLNTRGVADLAINKTVSNPTPNYLTNVTWTVTVKNNGPNTATNVKVTDILPSGLEYISHTATNGTLNLTTGIWDIGNLASGAIAILQIVTKVLGHNVAITDIANVTADQYDPNLTNNNANATIYVPAAADIGVVKTVNNSNPFVGDTISFLITATNNGPDNATGLRITDLLNAGLNLTSYTTAFGTYDNATGIWNIGNLANGASATLTLIVKVLTAGIIPNIASTSSLDQYDPFLVNNTNSVIVNATTPAAAGGEENGGVDSGNAAGEPIGETAFEEVLAAGENIPLQETGIPIGLLAMAVLMLLAGLIVPRK